MILTASIIRPWRRFFDKFTGHVYARSVSYDAWWWSWTWFSEDHFVDAQLMWRNGLREDTVIILHFHFQFVKIEKLNFLKLKEFFKKKAENLNFCAKYERKLLKINLCKGVHPKILNHTLWLISNRIKSGFARFAGSTIYFQILFVLHG